MKQITWIDNLKLRLGYGLAGNQGGIDSYTTMNLVRPNGVAPVGNSPVVTYETLRNINPDLKWEVKHTFNAGFDVGFMATVCCCLSIITTLRQPICFIIIG